MAGLQRAMMQPVVKRQNTMFRVADGPSRSGSVGDPSSYNNPTDRMPLPTRAKPRKPKQRPGGSQPYRDWQPGAGPGNQWH